MKYSAPPINEVLDRVECVVREHPPQTTTSELGAQINTFMTESDQFTFEMFVYSGEKVKACMIFVHITDSVVT